MSLLNEVEKRIEESTHRENIPYLFETYLLGITTNRYFYHPDVCRVLLNKADSLLSNNLDVFGDKHFYSQLEINAEWAGLYFDLDDYNKARHYYMEVLASYEQLPRDQENCFSMFRIAQYLAIIHERMGEFDAAINYNLASIDYYECAVSIDKPSNYALVFRNVAKTYLNKGDYISAFKYFKMGEDSLKKSWERFVEKSELSGTAYSLFETQASYFMSTMEHDKAIQALRKADPYMKWAEPFWGRYYLMEGKILTAQGKLKQAQESLRKSVAYISERGEKGVLQAEAYLSLGQLYNALEQPDFSMTTINKAIASLLWDTEIDKQGNLALNGVISNRHLFNALVDKYTLQLNEYEKRKTKESLQAAWKTNQLAIALLDSIANIFSHDSDKVIMAESAFEVYEDAIRIAHTLYQLTEEEQYFNICFQLADKSKGLVLLEKLRTVNTFAGVQQRWLDQERVIRSELLNLEKNLYELAERKEQDKILKARERYARLKHDYSDLMTRIREAAPGYYQLRFDHSAVTPREIQKHWISEDEAWIEYFLGEQSLMIFLIAGSKTEIIRKAIPEDFYNQVLQFRKELVSAGGVSPSQAFLQQSQYLYQVLLGDFIQYLNGIKKVTIIPDGVLSFIPFEVLVADAIRAEYLINRFAIRYALSASYLTEQLAIKKKPARQFFAGFVSAEAGNQAGSRNSTGPLPYAWEEVNQIADVLESRYQLFEKATKYDFIKQASNYRIVHIAMHSLVNHENPMFSSMMFAPLPSDTTDVSELYAIDLYGMQLNSDLAVLSACETGMGTLHRGEGIMSFSRAFAYAGVPAAVISLWKVPDKATSMIMVKFYRNLKEGYAKDEALQMAKSEFVNEYPQMAHPYYWSGFVLMGNAEPIIFPRTAWPIYAASLLVAALIISMIFWRFRARHR